MPQPSNDNDRKLPPERPNVRDDGKSDERVAQSQRDVDSKFDDEDEIELDDDDVEEINLDDLDAMEGPDA